MSKKGLVGGIVVGVALVFGGIFTAICSVRVPAGYSAVQYSMSGGVKDEILTQGWHMHSPLINTTLYTVGIEQSYLTSGDKGDSPKDESFSASSKEGKSLGIDLTYTYQYQPDAVVQVFNQFKGQSGTEVRDSFIKPNIVSWSKEVISTYPVSDILGEKKSEVNAKLTDYLANKFTDYGITISNVSLINIEVDSETQEAINAKIQAQQAAETQKINNQTAIDKATADAEVARTNAQAKADAVLIEAQAEADANKLKTDSITDELIRYNYVERWDGAMPKVSTSGSNGAGILIDGSEIFKDATNEE